MFRLADAYLMYAEAFLRGASNADGNTALGYVNAIRQRLPRKPRATCT